jgi:hydroxymethylbilane synthase
VDAIMVAAVAFERIGLGHHLSEVFETTKVVPQVAQGALAIECRDGDTALIDRLRVIEDPPSRRAVDAERAFLTELGGDCDLPAGAHATLDASRIRLDALLASLDGRIVLRYRHEGTDPTDVGRAAARHLLDRAGGSALLQR